MRIIAYIIIFFGVLFVWGAFSPQGETGWLVVGSITILAGIGLLWFLGRRAAASPSGGQAGDNVTLKLDLPGNVDIEQFKCQNCGSNLTMDNVKMVAGAPMVDCPYCGAAYQLSEAPKW